MNEEQWFEGERPEKEEARKKRWDEEFDRPVAQCAMEQMIFEELAEKEAEGDENGKIITKSDSTRTAAARRSIADLVNDAG
jgi:hypothetical protein